MASTVLTPPQVPAGGPRAAPLPTQLPPTSGPPEPIVWPRLGIRRVALVGMFAAHLNTHG